jgi:hypothetical protein
MAKRTYEQSLSFFQTRNTDKRGSDRELYRTPISVIEKIVDDIIERRPELTLKLWIDPCAADGRWANVIKARGIRCKSFDIEPLSDKVSQCNFYEMEKFNEDIFIIGNPPFSELRKFVNKALELTDECYFLGGSQLITGGLSDKVSLLHRFEGAEGNQKDHRSKITFIDTNDKPVIVWCCGAIFDKKEHEKFNRGKEMKDGYFRTSVQCFCQEDERVVNFS